MNPEEKAAERIKKYADAIFEFEESEAIGIIAEEFKAERALSQKLLEALQKYARHGIIGGRICEQSKHSDFPCTCGLEKLIAEAREVQT